MEMDAGAEVEWRGEKKRKEGEGGKVKWEGPNYAAQISHVSINIATREGRNRLFSDRNVLSPACLCAVVCDRTIPGRVMLVSGRASGIKTFSTQDTQFRKKQMTFAGKIHIISPSKSKI